MRGKLSWKRCEEIKQAVVEMFEECEVSECPIDPFYIAEKLCCILRPYSQLNPSDQEEAFGESDEGFSRWELLPGLGFRYVIYYNDMLLSEGRIRWTIFHELGHRYLDHHSHVNPDEEMKEIEEAEADFFAKYAIAPPVLVFNLDCNCPSAVAHHFDTSLEAADYLYDYCQKWLIYGPRAYTPYEIQLLRMFGFAAA